MLRRLHDDPSSFYVGQSIFLITRTGEILKDFFIQAILGKLVSLDRSPFPDCTKQGFTIDRGLLKPNWCEGRRKLYAGCSSHAQAEALAQKRKERPGAGCSTRRPL